MIVRIGLVGLDHWYNAIPIAEGIGRVQDARLVVIADEDAARAAEVASRCGGVQVERDWRAVVENPAVDVIVSMVSLDANPQICAAAAEAGKHVISNKPIARTLAEASAVVRSVAASGVHLLPGESRPRLGRRLGEMKRWAASEGVGRLCHVSASTWVSLPQRWPDDPEPGWFVDPHRTVGGAWIEHAIYQVDAFRWCLGDEVTSVSGTTARLLHPNVDAEDYGVGVMTFGTGLVATLENTWTAPAGYSQSSWRLVASEGMFELNGVIDRQVVIARSPAGEASRCETSHLSAHSEELTIQHLVAVIRGEEDPVATVEDAWSNLAACLAFYDSVNGRAPAIPEVPTWSASA